VTPAWRYWTALLEAEVAVHSPLDDLSASLEVQAEVAVQWLKPHAEVVAQERGRS
jgi:hypothetical protein